MKRSYSKKETRKLYLKRVELSEEAHKISKKGLDYAE